MTADIFGPDLLIVVLVVVVLLFGGAAIPKLARNLGSARSEFSKGMSDTEKNDADGKKSADDTKSSDGSKADSRTDTAGSGSS